MLQQQLQYYLIIDHRAPRHTNPASKGTIGSYERNSSWEGDQSLVGILNVEKITARLRE